jgi:glycosyltransferase involved in cell wall biosynthesis
MPTGLVSIVLPTFNRAALLGETIQSVLNQTYQNWELLIIDDGSTDDTREEVAKLNDQRIKYFSIEHSGIIGRARNVGVSRASGDYIAFLDSDDIWEIDKLEFQMAEFEKHPNAFFILGLGDQFGKNATPTPKLEKFFCGNIFLPFLLERRFIFYVPTWIFRKSVLEKIDPIDESFTYASDIDFFLRMAYAVEGIFSNRVVVKIRRDGVSHSSESEWAAYDEYKRMLEKLFGDGLLLRGQFTRLAGEHHYKLGLACLHHHNLTQSRKEFFTLLQLRPFHWKGWVRLVQTVVRVPFRKD